MARKADPEGKRTIGVLTKADTVVTREDMNKWLKVLLGQEEPLAHGYYVRQGGPIDLGVESAGINLRPLAKGMPISSKLASRSMRPATSRTNTSRYRNLGKVLIPRSSAASVPKPNNVPERQAVLPYQGSVCTDIL